MPPRIHSTAGPDPVAIRSIANDGELAFCARLMGNSAPWTTFGLTETALLPRLKLPGKEIHIAHLAASPVGFVMLNLGGPFPGYVQILGVLPEWRRRGIGTRLLSFAEDRIFREYPNVFICVSTFNTQAQKLYTRLGYERVGELKNYLVEGHGEILLRKTTGPLFTFRPASAATWQPV